MLKDYEVYFGERVIATTADVIFAINFYVELEEIAEMLEKSARFVSITGETQFSMDGDIIHEDEKPLINLVAKIVTKRLNTK